MAAHRSEDLASEYAGAVRLARRPGPVARAEDVAAEAFERVYPPPVPVASALHA